MTSRRKRVASVFVERHDARGSRRQPDELIVEEPLSIQLDGVLVSTTMRTPGHDFDLAVGLCWSEGLLVDAPVREIRYCATGSAVETDFNVVTVDTGGVAPTPAPRLGLSASACGICGREAIEELVARLRPLERGLTASPAVLSAVPERMRSRQELFALTGAVHAAAAFDSNGEPLAVREDIGRHNAVDKLVGRLVLDGSMPAEDLGLFVSGRASFEIIQKAWAAGFGTVLAVSAPSALAVSLANQARISLAGFVRDDGLNVYTSGPRDSA